MRTRSERGQTLVVAAAGMVGLVMMFLLVVNGGMLLLQQRALGRAVEDAAVAGLRTAQVGSAEVDQALAAAEARKVLAVELQNVRSMRESPADAANGATVTVLNPPGPSGCVSVEGVCHQGAVVEVEVRVHLCLPAWSCLTVSRSHRASLKTTVQAPPPATAVPEISITVVPVLTP